MEKSQHRVNYATEEYINILKPPVGMKSEENHHALTFSPQSIKQPRTDDCELMKYRWMLFTCCGDGSAWDTSKSLKC